MTGEKEPTVAIPVAMIKAAADQIPGSALASQFRDLLAKPTPRLVAVDLDNRAMSGPHQMVEDYLDAQPDLLTLLDGVIEEVGWRMYGIEPEAVTVMKARIRAALGVES